MLVTESSIRESGVKTIEQRICPKCDKSAFSSVFVGLWECPNCGEEIHPDGPQSLPEVAVMHQDGTICKQCGCHMGEKVGDARLCIGCED